MPETTLLLGFVAAALIVLLIPGPAVVYVVARSLAQGLRAGLVSVLGLTVGCLVHVAAATVGLSAILVTSAVAFEVVKALGAAYLIFLGIRTILGSGHAEAPGELSPRSLGRLFADGVLVNALNPKIAVFFLAFLPQFVDPAAGAVTRQVLFLGLLYVLLGLLTDGAYALLAGHVRNWVGRRLQQSPWPRHASGLVYIGLGVGTALADRDRL